MYEIKETVVLVTGGAGGIGAGVVKSFLEEGAKHVAILDVNTDWGNKLEQELSSKYGTERAKFYKCDVTTSDLPNAFDSVIKQFDYIDVVVNCAGILNDSYEAYAKCIEINVTALITSSFKAYELMRKDRDGKGGTIINLSSHGAFVGAPMLPVYCATKSAVLIFSRSLGTESTFSRTGVRVIAICLGLTDTSMVTRSKTTLTFDLALDYLMDEVAQAPKQTVSSAVQSIVEAYKRGKSASVWTADADETPLDITKDVTEGLNICKTSLDAAQLKILKNIEKYNNCNE